MPRKYHLVRTWRAKGKKRREVSTPMSLTKARAFYKKETSSEKRIKETARRQGYKLKPMTSRYYIVPHQTKKRKKRR